MAMNLSSLGVGARRSLGYTELRPSTSSVFLKQPKLNTIIRLMPFFKRKIFPQQDTQKKWIRFFFIFSGPHRLESWTQHFIRFCLLLRFGIFFLYYYYFFFLPPPSFKSIFKIEIRFSAENEYNKKKKKKVEENFSLYIFLAFEDLNQAGVGVYRHK